MLKFVIRRILWTIPVLLLVILMTFLMMRQIGGNPFRTSERALPRNPGQPREEVPRRPALVEAVLLLHGESSRSTSALRSR